jgi:PhnB protein
MPNNVKPVPEGYHAITPYLSVNGATEAIGFYKRAFGATEIMRMPGPGGRIGHAELKFGDSRVMLADEFPDMGFRSPHAFGGSPVHIHFYIDGVDAVVEKAVAAGAKVVRPVADQFYGDRTGTVSDPWGHVWHVATHMEDLSEDEMKKRAAAAMQNKPAA